MSKPTPLSGFPEFLPSQRIVEQEVIDRLRTVFELHGFAGIETRAAEPMAELLRKGEIDKEVYVVRRLHGEPGSDADGVSGDTLGLHYDLTVPFARYVLENSGKLDFPFRRYQIQKAWRGERPQEGRFREFTQADIDIVGAGELAFHYDVEVATVMVTALSKLLELQIPPMRLQVNNRKLLEGFYLGLGAADPHAVMRVVDKLDKVPAAVIATMLQTDVGLDAEQAASCLALAAISTTDASFVAQVRALGVAHELLDTGLAELAAVMTALADLDAPNVSVTADLRIARGLDYYTGTVFETQMSGFEHLGSICSGGRYDALADDGRNVYPGVGISLGVSRILVPLLSRGLLGASRSVPSAVLVAVVSDETRAVSETVARALRSRGIPTEVAPAASRYGKQIRFAQRRGIPFVWFPPATPDTAADSAPGGRATDGGASAHQVRDIRSGDQVAADPDSWSPPTDDLRPTVTAHL
ncbi:MAG TPA: histidine--tRNA ligase [Actinopolymorphaceae bacterium]|jgi:histidyl-tRNA synthetase